MKNCCLTIAMNRMIIYMRRALGLRNEPARNLDVVLLDLGETHPPLQSMILDYLGDKNTFTFILSCKRALAIVKRRSVLGVLPRQNIADFCSSILMLKLAAEHLKLIDFVSKPRLVRLMNTAAEHGRLESMQWLWDKDVTLDQETCACAAKNGHLAVLQWARAQGCEWNEDTCDYAAHQGRLHVLQVPYLLLPGNIYQNTSLSRAHLFTLTHSFPYTSHRPCSGHELSGLHAPGTSGPASMLQLATSWRCCSGQGARRLHVLGRARRAARQL